MGGHAWVYFSDVANSRWYKFHLSVHTRKKEDNGDLEYKANIRSARRKPRNRHKKASIDVYRPAGLMNK